MVLNFVEYIIYNHTKFIDKEFHNYIDTLPFNFKLSC